MVVPLQQDNTRPGTGSSDGGGNPRRATAKNQYVGRLVNGYLPRWLRNMPVRYTLLTLALPCIDIGLKEMTVFRS